MKPLMPHTSFEKQMLKRFAVLTLILSPIVLVVGCGEEPPGGETASPTASEPADDSDGSGTTSTESSGGSDSK